MNENQKIFEKYFSPNNLRLAWERMVRSNGKDIKDFFGIEIYSANLEKNLARLSEAIINGDFKPQRPFKYYEPKASKTNTTNSVGYSVSKAEQNVIKIPSKSGKIISEFSIVSDIFRHQDLLKYTSFKEIDSMQFTNETSPIVFLNTITYQIDALLNSKKTVQNNFYVSTILNMRNEEFYYIDYAETYGKKDIFQSLFFKYKSPLNFYLPY